jgi:hypothetical protein
MDSVALFSGRRIVVATKHGKEQVIAPHLSKELGLNCIVTDSLDTDLFGTFTGEVERSENPLKTARQKCLLAMEITSTDLAIASEGSFGPHPSVPFIPAYEEILLLIDKKNDWEFVVRNLGTKTNFGHAIIHSLAEMEAFLTQVHFPSHAVILKKSADDFSECRKGIHEESELRTLAQFFIRRFGQCSLETDMRAMHNPTRMKVIDALTTQLIKQIQSLCPICETPGYRMTDIQRGLPCAYCNLPTRQIKSEIYSCRHCHYSEFRAPSHSLAKEDPMYCDFCNP